MKYSIVIHKDNQSDYSVIVPDLPGCFSAGSTIDEAMNMAKEAIECHIEGMFLDGESIPKTQSIEIHQINPDYSGGIWGLVEIDLNELSLKSKRVNVVLPESLLNSVDTYARKKGKTRNSVLTNAVVEYMSHH